MEGDNAYYCDNDKCQTKVRAAKQLLLRQVPSVVTLQLKRFFKATAKEAARKNDSHVHFGEELDITRFLSSEVKEATPHVVLKLCGVVAHCPCHCRDSHIPQLPKHNRYIRYTG